MRWQGRRDGIRLRRRLAHRSLRWLNRLGIWLPAWLRRLRWTRQSRRGCRRCRSGRRGRNDLRDIYLAGQGGQALLRIGHHFAYPIAARLQLKGHVDIDPSFEKLRQLSISNIYVCVPLLGNHQIFFLIEDAKNKGQRIEVMVPFLLKME